MRYKITWRTYRQLLSIITPIINNPQLHTTNKVKRIKHRTRHSTSIFTPTTTSWRVLGCRWAVPPNRTFRPTFRPTQARTILLPLLVYRQARYPPLALQLQHPLSSTAPSESLLCQSSLGWEQMRTRGQQMILLKSRKATEKAYSASRFITSTLPRPDPLLPSEAMSGKGTSSPQFRSLNGVQPFGSLLMSIIICRLGELC